MLRGAGDEDEMSAALYLVRHAQTQPTALPVETWPLSEAGIQQAQRLAELPFWQDVQIICSSVEPKALQTAQIAAERNDLPVEPVFDLRELRRPNGLASVEAYQAAVREALENPFRSINGWEPTGEAQTRIMTAIERLLLAHAGKTLAVVSHGLVITLYLAYLADSAPSFDVWKSLPFASAFQIDTEERKILKRFDL
jgi:broad specificity phosphatase PhoE